MDYRGGLLGLSAVPAAATTTAPAAAVLLLLAVACGGTGLWR